MSYSVDEGAELTVRFSPSVSILLYTARLVCSRMMSIGVGYMATSACMHITRESRASLIGVCEGAAWCAHLQCCLHLSSQSRSSFMRCGSESRMECAPAYDALSRSFHYSFPRLQRLRQCPDLHPAVGPLPPGDSISSRYQRQMCASLHPRHCQLACPLPPCPPFQQHAHTRSSSNPDLLTHTAAVPPMS